MYTTQCVTFVGYERTIFTSLENGPSRRYISKLSNPKEEGI